MHALRVQFLTRDAPPELGRSEHFVDLDAADHLVQASRVGLRLTIRSGWAEGGEPAVYEFDQHRIVIGRRSGSDVLLPHPAISGHHATLVAADTGYAVSDEGSTNGTRVGDTPIPAGRRKPLRSGDTLSLGGFQVLVEFRAIAGATSAEQTAALALRMLRDARESALPSAHITWLNGPDEGRVLELPPAPATWLIGRANTCAVRVDDADCSREHAELRIALDGVTAVDRGAKNPLQINGRVVTSKTLRDRDELLVGSTVLAFEDPARDLLEDVVQQEDEAVEALPVPRPLNAEPAFDEAPEPASDIPEEPTEPTDDSPEPQPVQAQHAELPQTSGPPAPKADLIIYALAGTVLAASLAALLWLLQSG